MRVLLIDADSKIPNLALMKISAYHKARGDTVGFGVENPDKIYCSIIFDKNRHIADGLKFLYPDAELDIGGSGYDLKKQLPEYIERMTPDYSLYPDNDRYLGFTSRGCIRNCYFCIVPKKEGTFRKIYRTGGGALDSITKGYNFDKIVFLDNNILADKGWFFEITDEVLKRGLKVDFNQGLDIRLMEADIAQRIKELTPINDFKFAFDSMQYKDAVIAGIDTLKDAGVNVRKCIFYVYCHGNDSVPDAVRRARILKEHGATAYAMINRNTPQTKSVKMFKRWTRPWIFWSCDYNDFAIGCEPVPITDIVP